MRKCIPFVLLTILTVGTGCARPTAPNAPSADALTGDTKAIQGAWAIVSLENGRIENFTGDAKKEAEAMMREVRLVFEGNRMIIIERGEDEPVPFTLDETKSPKVMTLTMGGAAAAPRAGTASGTARPATSFGKSRPTTAFGPTARFSTSRSGTAAGTARPDGETWRWIYKLDGDMLMVAFIKSNKTLLPTEFKARAGSNEPGQPAVPDVTVITLKRTTDVPAPPRAGTRSGGRPSTAAVNRPATSK